MLVPKLRFKEFRSKYVEYKLKDIVDFYKGNILSKSDIAMDGKIPCILYGELYTKYSEITRFIISHTNNKSENLFYSRVNDVLIPCSGETALDISTSTCVLLDNVALGGDLNVLRPKKYIDGKYLSYLLSNKKSGLSTLFCTIFIRTLLNFRIYNLQCKIYFFIKAIISHTVNNHLFTSINFPKRCTITKMA